MTRYYEAMRARLPWSSSCTPHLGVAVRISKLADRNPPRGLVLLLSHKRALLALAAPTAMLADRGSATLLALAASTAMLADRGSATLLALAASTAMLADRGSAALRARAAFTVMLAKVLPFLGPETASFEASSAVKTNLLKLG